MNIYVGNLSRDVTDDDLRKVFEAFGKVSSAIIIKDKFTGESRGFGFVEMIDDNEAKTAMQALNNSVLKGRPMNINEARPRVDKRKKFIKRKRERSY
uniref:RNA-binding protein n=1 Tax=candidate division WOR-3 bacterium TaxID=2052148 RepID=A0A7V0Z4R9_UNCW3